MLLFSDREEKKMGALGSWQRDTSPFTLLAAAARTSASQSFNKFWNAGTRSFFVISGPTAFCNFSQTEKQPGWVAVSEAMWITANYAFHKYPLLRICLPPCSAPSRTCPLPPDVKWAWPEPPSPPAAEEWQYWRQLLPPRDAQSPADKKMKCLDQQQIRMGKK